MTVLLVEHPGADVAVAVRVCVLAVVGVFRCRDLNFFLLILTSAPTCHTAKRKKNTYHVNIFFFVSNNFFEGFLLPKKQATRFKSLTGGPMPHWHAKSALISYPYVIRTVFAQPSQVIAPVQCMPQVLAPK